jgi:hypothetical protein
MLHALASARSSNTLGAPPSSCSNATGCYPHGGRGSGVYGGDDGYSRRSMDSMDGGGGGGGGSAHSGGGHHSGPNARCYGGGGGGSGLGGCGNGRGNGRGGGGGDGGDGDHFCAGNSGCLLVGPASPLPGDHLAAALSAGADALFALAAAGRGAVRGAAGRAVAAGVTLIDAAEEAVVLAAAAAAQAQERGGAAAGAGLGCGGGVGDGGGGGSGAFGAFGGSCWPSTDSLCGQLLLAASLSSGALHRLAPQLHPQQGRQGAPASPSAPSAGAMRGALGGGSWPISPPAHAGGAASSPGRA